MFDYSLARSDWEEPGYTIVEHTASPPVDWSEVVKIAIHYPADPSIEKPATVDNLRTHLRASQRWYVANRGYSYGYNAVVWGGLSGEVRGDAFRCAANGNTTLNRDAFAIQIRVEGLNDDAAPASEADVAEVNRLIGWCEQQAGRTLEVVGHRDLKPTGCPGGAIYQQIQEGVFHADKESIMRLFKFDGAPPLFASSDGITAVWVSGPQWRKWRQLGLAGPDDIEMLDRAEAVRYSFVGGQPPEGYGGIWANSGRA